VLLRASISTSSLSLMSIMWPSSRSPSKSTVFVIFRSSRISYRSHLSVVAAACFDQTLRENRKPLWLIKAYINVSLSAPSAYNITYILKIVRIHLLPLQITITAYCLFKRWGKITVYIRVSVRIRYGLVVDRPIRRIGVSVRPIDPCIVTPLQNLKMF